MRGICCEILAGFHFIIGRIDTQWCLSVYVYHHMEVEMYCFQLFLALCASQYLRKSKLTKLLFFIMDTLAIRVVYRTTDQNLNNNNLV